jgi:DNA-directed RNA polymerase subunit RPC12/RpoP
MKKGGSLGENIKCVNCGWHWNTNQSEEYDKYVCHKCGFDNTTFYSSQIMKKGGITHEDIKNKTDKYKDVLKTPSNLLKISQMHKAPIEFLQSQLIKGMKVESEHTKREAVAKIIALHHLEEDPRYYIKLEKIENDNMEHGGLVYKKIYNKAGGGYTTIINGMLYNINKQYNKGTWVAQSDDGEYYKETQTLAELKDYLKHLNKKNTMAKGGSTKSIFYKGYKIGNDGMYKKMNKMAYGGMTYDEQEWKKSEERYELERLSELTYRAKRDIVDADDTDEAIQKFYDARNEYRAFEQSIKDREDNKRRDRNIESLIEDEIEDEKKQGDRYEYKELFKKSPALAALQSLKDLREWIQSDDSKDYDRKAGYSEEKIEENINRMSNYYSQSIKDLEYYVGLKKLKSKKLAEGGELNPDDKAIKSAMTHKAGSAGGLLVGNRHSEGGIKAINKSTNSPIEMEGGEVVITRNAVSDNKKREFEGKMMTNREILSRINESGGGVSFASGGDVPSSCKCSGKSYKYGGKSVSDYDIINSMNSNIKN